MDTAKNIVQIELQTDSTIDPTLNNGKTFAPAGEAFYTTTVSYFSMLSWPVKMIGDFISRDDLPALDEGGMTAPAIIARIKATAKA